MSSLPLLLPLATTDPTADRADLEPLRALVGDARIVALGECTHGTSEVFAMKARLIRELAAWGFDAVAIEASTPDSFPVDAYVRGEALDPAVVIRGMGFWTWSTPEVRDLAVWMRQENGTRAPGDALRWFGMDMQHPQGAAAWLATFLAERDPPLAAELGALGASSRGFAAATLGTPSDGARQLEISGWIRTEDLDGSAALWARGDGAERPTAFDNMGGSGPKGTAGWSHHRVTIALPSDTQRVAFGILVDGAGTAWFDELEVRLDGQLWTPGGADLQFEHGVPPVTATDAAPVVPVGEDWVAGGPDSAFEVDPAGREGAALRVVRSPARADPARIAAVVEDLRARDFPDADAVTRERLALALATMPQGWAPSGAAAGEDAFRSSRDAYLAENVAALLDRLGPDGRLVVWAHNAHVRRRDGWMGGALAERFGADYLPIGFACGSGTYTAAREGERGLFTYELSTPPRRSIEAHLAGAAAVALVDLRADDLPRWLGRPAKIRSIGAVGTDRWDFERAVLPEQYDLIVYLAHTTAAEQLKIEAPDR